MNQCTVDDFKMPVINTRPRIDKSYDKINKIIQKRHLGGTEQNTLTPKPPVFMNDQELLRKQYSTENLLKNGADSSE